MKTLASLRWILPFFKPYRPILLLIIFIAICSTILGLSYPYLSKILIDDVLIQQKYELKDVLLIGFAMMMLGLMLQAVNGYIYLKVTLSILKSLRVDFFDKLQRTVHDFFVRTKVGDITTRLNGDLNEIQSFITDGALQLITNILTLSFITGMLLYLDWRLFLYSLLFIPILIGSLLFFRPIIIKRTRQIRERNSDIQAHMIDTFTNIRLVKLATAEQQQSEKLDGKITTLNGETLSLTIIQSLAEGIPRSAIGISTGLVFFLGGVSVLGGAMTIGSLLAFTTYLGRFYSPIQSLAGLYLRFQRVTVSVERIHAFMYKVDKEEDMEHERERERERVHHRRQNINQAEGAPLLEFDRVSKLTTTTGQTYKDVSFACFPNTMTALVGPSGSGKSTLVDTIVRLTETTTGTIRFQGENIAEIPLPQLRREVVLVSQEQEMLNGTILDNLLIGFTDEERENLAQTDIEHCCRITGLLPLVRALPDQFQTIIGQRGTRLSGGEKQRLAITRALLKNPRLLILDEATSGLDQQAERQLFMQLKVWMGKTSEKRAILIISHRLSSIISTDQILLFNDGTIVDQGTHPELVKRSFLYKKWMKDLKSEVFANSE